ncbi:MAG: hypothetical protein M3163_13960 [Actinomycetota bacterium]|nr:hypothetical protein [Actinomycetota bacterium]
MAEIWILTDTAYLAQRMPRAVVDWLEGHGARAHLVVADGGSAFSSLAPLGEAGPTSPWRGLAPGDVVLPRSRHPFALALLKEAEARRAVAVNPWSAVVKSRNKVRGTLALARRGIPVPPTFVAHRPQDLAELDHRSFPLVLKPYQGDNARGIVIVTHPDQLWSIQWSDTMVLAQPFLDVGGIDLKLYVVDGQVWATERTSPLLPHDAAPVRAEVTPALRSLALACGKAFNLRLYGVDVLQTDQGPMVVDVNDFPNYTAVDEAPDVIGSLLLAESRTAPVAAGR